jgi:hypothetical protein
MKELLEIQHKLVASKDLRNNFGNYNYRSTESILASLKPLLYENKCTINITDELILIGSRFYVKAVATIKNEGGQQEKSEAFAREEESIKGMAAAQITGSASSYARKYALNGLLAIDDTKDADATNTHGKEEKTAAKNLAKGNPVKNPAKAPTPKTEPVKTTLVIGTKNYDAVVEKLKAGTDLETVKKHFTLTEEVETKLLKDAKNK